MAIVEVVKYNGNPDVFAWKYPSEELGTWTQLIVNESQEAILFKGGKALDVFGSGRHTLENSKHSNSEQNNQFTFWRALSLYCRSMVYKQGAFS